MSPVTARVGTASLDFTRRLIRAQEEERRRVAREIHDDFCQRLAVLTLQMQAVRASLKEEKAAPLVEEVITAFARLQVDLHALSHQLHSSRVELLGLVPAVAALCADMARQHQIEIAFDHGDASIAVDGVAALSMYRIVQEALQNVIKHSGASRVSIRLKADFRGVSLTVADNGSGFEPCRKSGSRGIGLQSMHERARMLGGSFRIDSGPPPHGTVITVTMPSEENERTTF